MDALDIIRREIIEDEQKTTVILAQQQADLLAVSGLVASIRADLIFFLRDKVYEYHRLEMDQLRDRLNVLYQLLAQLEQEHE